MIMIIKVLIISFLLVTIVFEIIIYSYIGKIKNDRLASINKVVNGETKVLEIKTIKEPFSKFHMDSNCPVDKNYWTYAAFEDYYNLPKDITIKIIK